MNDICKCYGKNCPKKESCYRYTVSEDPHYQTYFAEQINNNGNCEYYIETEISLSNPKGTADE